MPRPGAAPFEIVRLATGVDVRRKASTSEARVFVSWMPKGVAEAGREKGCLEMGEVWKAARREKVGLTVCLKAEASANGRMIGRAAILLLLFENISRRRGKKEGDV